MKSGLAMMAAMLLMATTPVPGSSAPGPSAPALSAEVGDLAWLAGTWVKDEGGEWTAESWAAPRGGVMLGHSLSGVEGKARAFEFLMLRPGADGALDYVAQPGGQAPVVFRMTAGGAAHATFENAAHDYPQRIHYVRDGDTMTATISLIDGSKAMSWTYMKQ